MKKLRNCQEHKSKIGKYVLFFTLKLGVLYSHEDEVEDSEKADEHQDSLDKYEYYNF